MTYLLEQEEEEEDAILFLSLSLFAGFCDKVGEGNFGGRRGGSRKGRKEGTAKAAKLRQSTLGRNKKEVLLPQLCSCSMLDAVDKDTHRGREGGRKNNS